MSVEILIVEDEGLIALDLKKKLEQAGYQVPLIADNADDALEGMERLRPSLVLMDIRLRGSRDGIEIAEEIRRRFRVPVIFVTAHADRETLKRARITEPFGYIVKPFHSVDFRAQIEMALWRHKMEQKLRASEAWLSATFRNVADGLITTDHQGNIAFMNTPASEMTGRDAEKAKGEPLLDVFRVFDETTGLPMVHPLETIYDGREVVAEQRTFQLRRCDGADPVLVETVLSVNRDEETLLGIIVVFRDVTSRRKAEEENRQLQKMNALALMAVGLGRELSASQRRMDQSLTQLIARAQGQSQTLRLLGEVYERCAYQQTVMQQLIALDRKDPSQNVLLDLNQLLAGMKAKFGKALGLRRSLHLKLEPGVPLIKAHAGDMRDNLLRLVIDARQAMPDGGEVDISTSTIRAADGKQSVRVTIQDTGRSIRANAKERVFDPYYQSRPGDRNPGFSLFLVYQFVSLSGGQIEIASAPGAGTAYLLTFPEAEAQIAATA